jgi:hypothetical protein
MLANVQFEIAKLLELFVRKPTFLPLSRSIFSSSLNKCKHLIMIYTQMQMQRLLWWTHTNTPYQSAKLWTIEGLICAAPSSFGKSGICVERSTIILKLDQPNRLGSHQLSVCVQKSLRFEWFKLNLNGNDCSEYSSKAAYVWGRIESIALIRFRILILHRQNMYLNQSFHQVKG